MLEATRSLTTAGAVFVIATLAGCALPAHNNTLIFAVHRKVGFDVTPTNSTNAGVTFGYSSNEFAWVPLWANGPDGKPLADCDDGPKKTEDDNSKSTATSATNTTSEKPSNYACAKDPRFMGKDTETGNRAQDAYSVFASFGGDFQGSASNEVSATGKLASFFATGMAAQNLSEKMSDDLLSANTPKKRKEKTPEQLLQSQLQKWLTQSADKKAVIDVCVNAMLSDVPSLNANGEISGQVKGYSPEDAAQLIGLIVDMKAKNSRSLVGKRAEYLTLRWEAEMDAQKKLANTSNIDPVADTRKAICK